MKAPSEGDDDERIGPNRQVKKAYGQAVDNSGEKYCPDPPFNAVPGRELIHRSLPRSRLSYPIGSSHVVLCRQAQKLPRVVLEDLFLVGIGDADPGDGLDGSLGAVVAELGVERSVRAEKNLVRTVKIVGAHQRRRVADETGVGEEPAEIIDRTMP